MSDQPSTAQLDVLYTSIGRGHPFYLDGIVDFLKVVAADRVTVNTADVFGLSHGRAKLAWQAVRWLYRHGASGGFVGSIYARLRKDNDYSDGGRMVNLLARDIRRQFSQSSTPLLIAHPSLVGMLAGRASLFYQHGELVAPKESLVSGASAVFVPTSSVAQEFIESGYDRERVIITGLCIEQVLVDKAAGAFESRLKRFDDGHALTGLFVSSGAEPKPHVDKLVRAAVSVVKGGGKVIVLARTGGRFAGDLTNACRAERVQPVTVKDTSGPWPETSNIVLALFSSRREENDLAAAAFDKLDYVVGPPHERTNWAMGLGLPMFAVTPTVGPFAPLNLHVMFEHGVARALSTGEAADGFARMVDALRNAGELRAMARHGRGKIPIDGFATIAQWLVDSFTSHPPVPDA